MPVLSDGPTVKDFSLKAVLLFLKSVSQQYCFKSLPFQHGCSWVRSHLSLLMRSHFFSYSIAFGNAIFLDADLPTHNSAIAG
ncbi:MAG: hypothetical protein AAFO06_22275 [Cyanobacteria bacterium J06597_16]